GDADLIAFFQQRLLKDSDRARIEAIVKKLSSKAFKEREQANADILKEGPSALPVLRKMMGGNVDLESKRRMEKGVKDIEAKSPSALLMAAARILKYRRLESACPVLLDYVAVAPDDVVEEEVFAAIYGLSLLGAKLEVLPPAVKSGTLNPVVVQTLKDKEPSRRAIGALVVGYYGNAAQRAEVGELLNDKDAHVRFRAAQGLLCGRDARGFPVLIEMLDKGPLNLALLAEDLLSVVAGDKGPNAPMGETAELRKKCHDAWQEWYNANKSNIDLAKVDVDSPFGSLATRASAGATQFIKAIVKMDVKLPAKVTDVPFTLGGMLTFNTRQELDNFLQMIAKE